MGDDRLHVLDKTALDVASSVEIELEIGHGGLDVVMAQAVFDVRDGLSPMEKIHGPAVAERVDRVDVLKALLGQGPGQMLLTDPVDTVAGKFLPSLIDKKAVLIKGFWGDAIFFDVETEELRGPFLDIDQAESVPLSQDGQGVLLGVEVVDMECGNLGSPGP